MAASYWPYILRSNVIGSPVPNKPMVSVDVKQHFNNRVRYRLEMSLAFNQIDN